MTGTWSATGGEISPAFEPGLVSVIVPVFDGQRWLADAIGSVRAQTYSPIEIVAVDDGSTDLSAAILAGYPDVHTIRQPNGGCAVARNRGIAGSRGEYLAFIDQDDRWIADKLERQVTLLRERPDAGYALGRQMLFLEPGCPLPRWFGERSYLFDRPHVGYLPGTMLVRRSTFVRIGVFDEAYPTASDGEWLVRAHDTGVPMAVAEEVVIEKRIHDANLSSTPGNTEELLLILARSMRRRRAQGNAGVVPLAREDAS